MWRLLAKALGEKATPCSRESDRVALIRLAILASYLITNCFIVAGVIRHWGPKRPQYPAVRDFECARDGSAAHATTMHEEDQFAVEGLGHGAGLFV
jgi:hypothetical protein